MSEKEFLVGTFYNPECSTLATKFSAYTRYYNKDWSGCVEYRIKAPNGYLAKRRALKLRREREGFK